MKVQYINYDSICLFAWITIRKDNEYICPKDAKNITYNYVYDNELYYVLSSIAQSKQNNRLQRKSNLWRSETNNVPTDISLFKLTV